jgi:hypothetical protein
MDQRDFTTDDEERGYRALAERLSGTPGFMETLPDMERHIAQGVAQGRMPYEIAMDEGISEDAVWNFVRSLANGLAAPSQEVRGRGYETAGLGADTDPGVTGGYGDTGFGSIGNEGGEAVTEEPEEEGGG